MYEASSSSWHSCAAIAMQLLTLSQALKLLSQLLFGSRPGGFAGPEATGRLGPLPPLGVGLQLSGNSQQYYDADNSLLHRQGSANMQYCRRALLRLACTVGYASALREWCQQAVCDD